MEWIKKEDNFNVPVKSWCKDIEDGAMAQATDLAKHPVVFRHVALMPDCHPGYGMPIGGVIACISAVIPNARVWISDAAWELFGQVLMS